MWGVKGGGYAESRGTLSEQVSLESFVNRMDLGCGGWEFCACFAFITLFVFFESCPSTRCDDVKVGPSLCRLDLE